MSLMLENTNEQISFSGGTRCKFETVQFRWNFLSSKHFYLQFKMFVLYMIIRIRSNLFEHYFA